MAIQNEPTRISTPFADAGTKNVIPETMPQPSATAAASWQAGFPTVCSLPLSAGGIPPARNDFNGIFNTMTQSERFTQEGGVWAWDATVDYGTNRVVLGSDGKLYWSIAQSGPNVGGAQNPTTDTTHVYWGPAPMVSPFVLDDSSNIATTGWVRDAFEDAPIYIDAASGSDANDGLTSGTAVKTFAQALSMGNKRTGSPTKYIVAAGTYHEDITVSGTYVIFTLLGNIEVDSIYATRGASLFIGKSGNTPSATLSISSSSRTPCVVDHGSHLSIYIPLEITATTSYDCLSVLFNSFANFTDTVTFTSNGARSVIITQLGGVCRFEEAVSIDGTSVAGNALDVSRMSLLCFEKGCSSTNIVAGAALSLAVASTCVIYGACDLHGAGYATVNILGSSCLQLYGTENAAFNAHGGSIVCGVSSCSYFRNESSGTVSYNANTSLADLILVADNSTAYLGTKMSFSGTVSSATIEVTRNSSAILPSAATVSGTVTGKKFSVRRGSQLDVAGAGANRIPGSDAGTVNTSEFAYYG